MKRTAYFRFVVFSAFTIWLVLAASAGAGDCQKALAVVFRNEGGFSTDRHDPGNYWHGQFMGTKYGICARDYGAELSRKGKTIRGLTLQDAALIYNRDYFKPLGLDRVRSQWLSTMFLDTAVNCGTGTSAILIKRTINRLNGLEEDVPMDPGINQGNLDWINEYTRTRLFEREKDTTRRALFGSVFREMRARRYAAIVRAKPKLLRYLPTWLERTYE
jgi:lysozyme family protein